MSSQLTKIQENINTLPFIPSHQGRGDIRIVLSHQGRGDKKVSSPLMGGLR